MRKTKIILWILSILVLFINIHSCNGETLSWSLWTQTILMPGIIFMLFVYANFTDEGESYYGLSYFFAQFAICIMRE